MFFVDKRIGVICDELQKLSVKQKVPITTWQIKPGNYLTPAEADAAEAPYATFGHQESRNGTTPRTRSSWCSWTASSPRAPT